MSGIDADYWCRHAWVSGELNTAGQCLAHCAVCGAILWSGGWITFLAPPTVRTGTPWKARIGEGTLVGPGKGTDR
jgi:hypothetical protein